MEGTSDSPLNEATVCHPFALGPVIGVFLVKEIHEWIELEEGFYGYEGLSVRCAVGFEVSYLRDDELVVWPGFLYRLRRDLQCG